MSLKDALEAGLADLPDCQTVCYVDMPSGLVLGAASRSPVAQELLDRLALLAATLLDSPALAALRDRLGTGRNGATGVGASVMVMGQGAMHVLVRSPSFPEHALCYICARTADPGVIERQVAAHRSLVAAAL